MDQKMMDEFNWQALCDKEMEQHFNPRVTVADAAAEIARFSRNSSTCREGMSGLYDIRYGEGALQTLDFHPGAEPDDKSSAPPLIFFVHGGYWRGLDKHDHGFFAKPFVDQGISVANINYDLCPTITLDQMVVQIAEALKFCIANGDNWKFDPSRVFLAGHSAGAHLVASLLSDAAPLSFPQRASIKGAILITGVYDPRVALRISVNEEIKLDDETAQRNNCFEQSLAVKAPILAMVGGSEPKGWIDQTLRYGESCRNKGISATINVVEGANHYTVLELAADATSAVFDDVKSFIRTN